MSFLLSWGLSAGIGMSVVYAGVELVRRHDNAEKMKRWLPMAEYYRSKGQAGSFASDVYFAIKLDCVECLRLLKDTPGYQFNNEMMKLAVKSEALECTTFFLPEFKAKSSMVVEST